MKQQIIRFSLIVALVAIFAFIECRAETKPAFDKVSETTSLVNSLQESMSVPAAIPVLTPEEAVKANDEALKLYQEKIIIAETEGIKYVAEAKSNNNKSAPAAIPVLTPEEAIKANKEAIRFQRNKAIADTFKAFIHKIGLNNNRIIFAISLLPLLLIFDVLLFKKRKSTGKVVEYFSLSRRMRILFSVSLLAFGILVFVPWSVYFGNSLQFPFIFQDFVNWNLLMLTISIFGACIILLLIPPIISDYFVAIIAGLGLCVYVQAMFMNRHLGTMNGVEPAWSEHQLFGIINITIWLAIVLSLVVLRKTASSYFSKAISMVTGIILFLELLATASMVFSASQNVWTRTDTYFVDGSKQFQLSKEKNVVVLVMDALGSGFVKKCFESYPETKEIVKDFIWYEDARSNYQMTFPGLIHELTGTILPAPASHFYGLHEKMWHSPAAESFYRQINEAGYDARLYTAVSKFEIGDEDSFHDYFSNVDARDITYEIDYKKLHHCLRLMSGFSLAPYFFKRYFFYAFNFSDDVVEKQVSDISSDQKWIPRTNSEFLKKLQSSGITSDANKPIFSFNYIYGAHKPWTHDEKCVMHEVPFKNPMPTTRGCFYILSELIRFMKEKGIYDNTAIVVFSDHGGLDSEYSTPYDMSFMIKPFYENKAELTIDHAKVQSIDILPTLLEILCGGNANFNDFEGFTANSIPDNRVRKVYRFYLNKDLPPIDPELDHCYPGCRGIEEYIFKDLKSFGVGTKSKSFVRQIPLVTTSEEEK